MIQPLSALETDGKDGGSQGPVGKHSDPDGDGAEVQDAGQEDGQSHTAKPHGSGGYQHGEFDIACGAEPVSGNEG